MDSGEKQNILSIINQTSALSQDEKKTIKEQCEKKCNKYVTKCL